MPPVPRPRQDYVWLSPGLVPCVRSCAVLGATPAPHDPTLYPSDHMAVAVALEIPGPVVGPL
jgi:hypothetical protein